MFKFVAICLLVLVAYAEAHCHDCTATQCCVMGLYLVRDEACENLGELGDSCNAVIRIGNRYPAGCPCLPDYDCKVAFPNNALRKTCQLRQAPTTATPSPPETESPTPAKETTPDQTSTTTMAS